VSAYQGKKKCGGGVGGGEVVMGGGGGKAGSLLAQRFDPRQLKGREGGGLEGGGHR